MAEVPGDPDPAEPAGVPLVVALGNVLRGDDGAGAAALSLLSARGLDSRARLLQRAQVLPELAEDVARASLLVLIDARADAPPGQVDLQEIGRGSPLPAPFSHDVPPGALLALSAFLFGQAPRGFSATIGGAAFDPGEGLSPEVAASLPSLCDAVESLLASAAAGNLRIPTSQA